MFSATEDLRKTWIIANNVLTIYLHNARKAFFEIIKKTQTHPEKHPIRTIYNAPWALLFPHFLRFRNAKRTQIYQNYNTCVVGVHRGLTCNGWISGASARKPLILRQKRVLRGRRLNNIKTSSARLWNSWKLFLNNLFTTFIPFEVNKYFCMTGPAGRCRELASGVDPCGT